MAKQMTYWMDYAIFYTVGTKGAESKACILMQ